MQKTSAISAKIDPDLKRNAEEILHDLGLSVSQAITLFYRQIELRKGLPFAVELPIYLQPKGFGPAELAQDVVHPKPTQNEPIIQTTQPADWDNLLSLVEDCTVETGISDLADQHDHYPLW
ncbi:MAG: type II toxin-antitoxin system RelB/DinJ family antitoxin [Caldilineaceae bacterium]